MTSIREFQEIMRKIYFERDNDRGVNRTFAWFKDEVKELEAELQSKNKLALENEFADVLAWLSSLANLLNIDLEEVFDNTMLKINARDKDRTKNQ